MRVLGLDVSRNFAVGFVLETLVFYPKDWFYSFPTQDVARGKKVYTINSKAYFFPNNCDGLELFNSLKPDIVVLEPTGYWYSALWNDKASAIGAEVCWMPHQSLKALRSNLGFKVKDDDVDAFCLAYSYFDPGRPKKRYLQHYNHELLEEIRLAYFERLGYTKDIVRGIARIKKWLELEFPEIATRDLDNIGLKGHNPTLGHIVGLSKNRQFPKQTIGRGISLRTKEQALDLLKWQSKEQEMDERLTQLISHRQFKPYLKVFKIFGLGLTNQVSWLIRAYPLERFYEDGLEVFDKKRRSLSLRRFQAYAGLGFAYEKSGEASSQQKKIKKAWQGSSLHRATCYFWLLSNPTQIKQWTPQNAIQAKLKAIWVEDRVREIVYRDKRTKIKTKEVRHLPSLQSLGKDGICRFLFVFSRLLWRELVREIHSMDF